MYERFGSRCSVNEGEGGGIDNEKSHCIVSVRGSSICGVAYTVERLLYAWDGM